MFLVFRLQNYIIKFEKTNNSNKKYLYLTLYFSTLYYIVQQTTTLIVNFT